MEPVLISDLPSDIVSMIISCLPIKSILRCKLVCKHWCSIIKSPCFKLPTDRIALLNLRFKDFFLFEPDIDFVMRRYSNGIPCRNLGRKAVIRFNVGCDFASIKLKKLELVNSCNGLVCLAAKSSRYNNRDHFPFIVCNPVTSDFVLVNQPTKPRTLLRVFKKGGGAGRRSYYRVLRLCGFGYSGKSSQYKLLRLCCVDGALVAEIYTLGCGEEWRRIECPPQIDGWGTKPLFLEGLLHWVISHGKGTLVTMVTFDFQEEKFSLVSLPSVSNDFDKIQGMNLSILRQQLCFCVWGLQGDGLNGHGDIWVMDEYGVKESWRKLFVYSDLEYHPYFQDPYIRPFKPLAYLKNGEILMLNYGDELLSYNVRSEETTLINIPGFNELIMVSIMTLVVLEAVTFSPNFAPIKSLITPRKDDSTIAAEANSDVIMIGSMPVPL